MEPGPESPTRVGSINGSVGARDLSTGSALAPEAADLAIGRLDARMRRLFVAGSLLVIAFVASLIVRSTGSYYTPVDGWGVDAFELATGAVCVGRYFDVARRSGRAAAPLFPLVLGAACWAWALGDVAVTVESLGGGVAPALSVADGFYLFAYPLFFAGFIMVVRRGHSGSLIATSLDGLIVGLAAAAVSAAFLLSAVLKTTGGSDLSAATQMAYPIGDLLLLALAIGGLAILPSRFRRFLVLASCAFAVNATGDTFNLLAPNGKLGYICNAAAWPISLLVFAIATWVQPAHLRAKPANASAAGSEKTAGFVLPAIGAVAGTVVLLFASFGHADRTAIALATVTLLAAGVRLSVTVREARALSSARFRSLIDNAWDLIVVAEEDLEIAYITPSADRVLGYDPSELKGLRLTELVHPDDQDPFGEHLRLLHDDAAHPEALETRVRHRNGEWRTVAWTATNLLEDPSVRGYVLNGGDVTEIRRAAEDLAAARDGALTASKSKSKFLSTMSHEIRTPMNGVIGLTELLLDTRLDDEQQEFASGIRVSAENLLVIINDILDFSKIEAGKLDLEEAPFELPTVAEDIGRIMAEAAHSKGLELLVDIQPEIPPVLLGDVVRVKQVLLNLASNAVKFTTEGEVAIRLALLDQTTERVAIRFEVIDTGIGIAPADQERLFRTFTQADSSTTRKFGGTGLGLAICQQLVDLMGGKLGVTSAPGEGSTFWFELSLPRGETARTQCGEPRSLLGHRALIVDDNATNRRILMQQFRSVGIEATEAIDGYQALELAASEITAGPGFDLAVIDLNMPGMDGIELAQLLKADPATAAMTLFLLSSSGERLSRAEAHLRGFAACMTKPVRSSELYDCLITGINTTTSLAPTHAPSAASQETPEVTGVILVVEDNTLNQLVASKVLAKLGYDYEIANHGGEALTAVQARTFDAVLMDCQMPEMDGYEATRQIRLLERDARHTPIIAMTAAAMDGDREACLDAGMDDYTTKPIRPEAIAALLERWITPAAGDAEPETTTAGQGPADPLDRAQIAVLLSLDDGEGAVLSEVIDEYLTQTTETRDELEQALNDRDADTVKRAAHKLKGASANVGAAALVAVCIEIEQHAQRSEHDQTAELLGEFDAKLTRVREALGALTATPATTSSG